LQNLVNETRTIVIYEAPHRLVKTLNELKEVLGDRKISVCRELTKLHEEKTLTTISECLNYYKDNEPRGEYVLVIEGRSQQDIREEERMSWEEMSLDEHMAYYESQGIDRKEAMKLVAKDRGVSKRDVYRELCLDKSGG
jgi:16S rRNA (cytidine1402-2'-O)-methyltransferase